MEILTINVISNIYSILYYSIMRLIEKTYLGHNILTLICNWFQCGDIIYVYKRYFISGQR